MSFHFNGFFSANFLIWRQDIIIKFVSTNLVGEKIVGLL